MLTPSPSSMHRHKGQGTGFTDFKQKLGDGENKGGAENVNPRACLSFTVLQRAKVPIFIYLLSI